MEKKKANVRKFSRPAFYNPPKYTYVPVVIPTEDELIRVECVRAAQMERSAPPLVEIPQTSQPYDCADIAHMELNRHAIPVDVYRQTPQGTHLIISMDDPNVIVNIFQPPVF